MIKRYITLLFIFLCICFSYTQIDYETEIQSIFDTNCIVCHSAPGASAGLELNSYENLMAGDIIILPEYENSLLYERITGIGGYMPPPSYSDPLTAEDVNLITTWLSEGANFGGEDPPWDVINATDCNMTIAIPLTKPSITVYGTSFMNLPNLNNPVAILAMNL